MPKGARGAQGELVSGVELFSVFARGFCASRPSDSMLQGNGSSGVSARVGFISLETRVASWIRTRIGPGAIHPQERAMRLLEEAIELAQAEGISQDLVLKQVGYVFARSIGDPVQEAGGVAVCLLGWCAGRGTRLEDIMLRELHRIEAKPIHEIRGSLARKTDADLVVCAPLVETQAASTVNTQESNAPNTEAV